MTLRRGCADSVPCMAGKQDHIRIDDITRTILTVRGQRVMLDRHLAALYGVETRALNQAVRRNAGRFPADFVFRLSREEVPDLGRLRSQNVILKRGENIKYGPLAYTEHGAVMAAMVLNSPRAVQMSVFVVRAFLRLRAWVAGRAELAARLTALERRVGVHDSELLEIIQTIRRMLEPPVEPRRRIGFRPAAPAASPRRRPPRPSG
jgi:ORF6N domain